MIESASLNNGNYFDIGEGNFTFPKLIRRNDMDQDAYKAKVISLVKQLINCISSGEFDKIPSNIDIHKTWYSGEMIRDEAINEFKEWLEGTLNLWSEESGKEYVIDAFDEASMDCDDLEVVLYDPKSNGEKLDFWFEIFVNQNEDGEPTLIFNVNM